MSNTQEITCIVVDDNLVDRLTIQSFLKRYPNFRILNVFESSKEALAAYRDLNPDVLFLDIDMPEMNGLELRKELIQVPACVFITSYAEYALESFEVEAFDFLIKPFNAQRFDKTISRLTDFFDVKRKAQMLEYTLGTGTVFIKEGTTQIKLQLPDIIYLEAMKDYTGLVTSVKRYMVLESISSLLEQNMFRNFVRIHRSFAVQKHFVQKYNSRIVELINGTELPVGRSFKDLINSVF